MGQSQSPKDSEQSKTTPFANKDPPKAKYSLFRKQTQTKVAAIGAAVDNQKIVNKGGVDDHFNDFEIEDKYEDDDNSSVSENSNKEPVY